LFGLVPEGFEFGAGDVGEGSSLLAGDTFHFLEATGEFGVGFLHGEFGIDMQEAREVDGNEENVAELALDAFGGFVFVEDLPEFAGFFLKLVEDAFDVVLVEADAGGFAGELEALKESRKGFGDAIEIRGRRFGGKRRGARAFGLTRRSGERCCRAFGALGGFDLFPVAEDVG